MQKMVIRFGNHSRYFQVLKEDLIESLEGIIDLTSNLLKQLLKIDMAETLNLDTLMDAVKRCIRGLLCAGESAMQRIV